ncbi:hypothetical protein M885DRAFT_579365 [Pelagophyceae sp. CCMP2097]|nr:hypothetical protein M885DRAFT_579365 [Pelagophyceae sp. CCMP2097]
MAFIGPVRVGQTSPSADEDELSGYFTDPARATQRDFRDSPPLLSFGFGGPGDGEDDAPLPERGRSAHRPFHRDDSASSDDDDHAMPPPPPPQRGRGQAARRAAPAPRAAPASQGPQAGAAAAPPPPQLSRGPTAHRAAPGPRATPASQGAQTGAAAHVPLFVAPLRPVFTNAGYTTLEKAILNQNWKACRDIASAHDGFAWRTDSAASRQVNMYCTNHVYCPARLRIIQNGTTADPLGASLYSNGAAHGTVETTVPFQGQGIGGEFRAEVREIREKLKVGATGILVELELRYGKAIATKDPNKFKRIPSLAKLKSHVQTNLTDTALLLSNLELMNMTAAMKVNSYEELEAVTDENATLVVATFHRIVQIPDLDEEGDELGTYKEMTTLGFVCSTKKILLWLRELLRSLARKRRPWHNAISADGTYRLCKGSNKAGAVLVEVGFHDVSYKKPIDTDTHTFLAMLYMFVQAECGDAYKVLFRTLRELPKKFLDMPDTEIMPKYGGLDRASYIAKAYLAVWPDSNPALE